MKKYAYIAIVLILSLLELQAQKKFTVVIDPGHGGKDPGCVGSISKEKTINLSVALKLGTLIEKNHPDAQVVYTRRTDVFIPLDERANMANKHKADLFISIHANSVKRGSASGTETYTLGLANSSENLDVAMRENSVILMEDDYLRKYEGFDPKSTESYIIFELIQNKHMEQSVSLASEIQKSFVNSKRGNRGVRQAGLLVLRKTGMPSVLIELGFISNRAEERFMASNEGQKTLAQSIYKAFDRFKNDYVRKSGNMADITNVPPPGKTVAENTSSYQEEDDEEEEEITGTTDAPVPPATAKNTSSIIYKVQILTSDKKLSVKDKLFNGYDDISFYIEKGVYKYTYGSTSDYKEIISLQKKAAKDFKGAFIIKMKDGNRIYN
ncbi:MAG: N-acetylmuramoyl-L-alanine amidase [Tannerella sp.]|jgi:N-acetylmuramoyl-L-alanine amidase|nr:N-acetylmuramoyl-L-alanine amidase [Tannerella sp.]